MTLDHYYQACEDAIRCQAAHNTLGVLSYLQKAAQLRDALLRQAKARFEPYACHTILDYWDRTLSSLPAAARSGTARISTFSEPSEVLVPMEEPEDWEGLADPDRFVWGQ